MNAASVGNSNLQFYVEAHTKDGAKLPNILVDTGSMISTIILATAQSFNLSVESCAPIEIEYGKITTQWTDSIAKLGFFTVDIPNITKYDLTMNMRVCFVCGESQWA